MTKLYVTEYSDLIVDHGRGATAVLGKEIANQVVDYTAGHAESAVFNINTTTVRLHTDAICSFLFGAAPVAATTNARLAANQTEYFGVGTGSNLKVSAISNT